MYLANIEHQKQITNRLLIEFDRAQKRDRNLQNADAAWDYLSAAHIVAQTGFKLHALVHWRMLQYAFQEKNVVEFFGQLMRLSLVPVGHLLGRLPLGNHGRSNVSAFRSMEVSSKFAALIARAKLDEMNLDRARNE